MKKQICSDTLQLSRWKLRCCHCESVLLLLFRLANGLDLSGKWLFKSAEYAGLFKKSCNREENNGINRPHDQVFQRSRRKIQI